MQEDKLNINPAILTWHREEAGFSIDGIAQKLNVKVDRVAAWEAGGKQPTIKQMESLSENYGCSVFSLLESVAPAPNPIYKQFRKFATDKTHDTSIHEYAVRKSVRHLHRQSTLATQYEEFELPGMITPLREVIEARLNSSVTSETVRTLFALRAGAQPDAAVVFRQLRKTLESFGILVVSMYGVSIEAARGLSIPHSLYPVVAVNSKEMYPPQQVQSLFS